MPCDTACPNSSAVVCVPLVHCALTCCPSHLCSGPRLQFGGLVLPRVGPPLTPAHECRTVLAWQQLFLSLAVPALLAAVAEARLWRRHQEERRQSGLPPEGGLQSRLYKALDACLLQAEWPDCGLMGWLHLGFVVWLLASVLHLLAVLVSQ